MRGKPLRDVLGKKGHPLGQEIMQKATEGTIKEVTYWGRGLAQRSHWSRLLSTRRSPIRLQRGVLQGVTCRARILVAQDRMRQSRLLKIQYAAITAMKNDMRSARPAIAAIMVA